MSIKSSIQDFGMWLFRTQPTKVIRYNLDEELIKRDNLIKAQQQQLQGRDAQLAKISAEKIEKKESGKSKEYTQELAVRARNKEEEIKSKRYKHTFSWRFLFNKMGYETKPTKFGRKVELTDKDDTIVFGFLGDLLTADNGLNIITDQEGNVMNMAKNMTDLIWKPDGLANYLKRNRIPLALDQDMNPVIDLEEEEHPDVLYDEKDDEYKETLVRQRPVKEMLIERDERLRTLQRYTERLEKMSTDKDDRLKTLSRQLRVLENSINSKESRLSETIDKSIQFENKVGNMQNMINKLSELKVMHESEILQKDKILDKVMVKVAEIGNHPLAEQIRASIYADIKEMKNLLPKTIIQEKEVIAEPNQTAQPGGRLK